MDKRREMYETALRMQRVAQGHVSSLEAHLEAIKEAVSIQPNISYVSMVEHVRGILDGSINIFSGEEQQPVEVVAAVRRQIRHNGDLYWVCRRTDGGRHDKLAGMWEYPGGKVEEGETHIQATRREMREEFGVEITFMEDEPLAIMVSPIPRYSDETVRVTFFAVAFLTDPELRVHDQAKWCTVEELQLDNHLSLGAEFNRRLLAAKEQT